MPYAIVMTLIFSVCALVLTPFAWIKVIMHKCLLAKRIKNPKMYGVAILYFLLGLPILFLTALVDSYWFFIQLYQWNMAKVQEANNYPKISLAAFNRFYRIVNRRSGLTCNPFKLVMELRSQFKTNECIFGVLYANNTRIIKE